MSDGTIDTPAEVLADDAAEAKRGRYGWLSLVIAAIFGLFYAYDVWEAVGNLISLPADYRASGLDAGQIPWGVLIVALVVPPAVFILAFLIGRRQNALIKAFVFLVGLAVVAALSLGLIALAEALRPVL